jgi:signal transduction histidine kinase
VREELPLAPVDAAGLLREMLAFYPEFQPPKAEMRLEGDFPRVLGNTSGLTQCFSNLLRNAVKFARPGVKPQVRIWAEVKVVSERISESVSEKTDKGKVVSQRISESASEKTVSAPSLIHSPTDSLTSSFVRIWFEDNGVGIPKGCEQRIFAMFQRLHGPQYPGTGIGLALVRKVMERMGGHVGVESEVGKGSRFWVELKAVEPGF